IMDNNRVNVHVHEGRLIGIVEEAVHDGHYVAFRGIPYAKPPVGELRFKDPLPPERWFGDRDASKYGNIAVQVDLLTREIVGDEDCLYLNVYTIDIVKKRPIMVWIHGGGFAWGSGNAAWYGPDYIVRKDVVLVTLNYRLGALGFLNLYDKVVTGNQGLKDVVKALKWIQKNISQFGGDPNNVTIFGESAGGAIVHYLNLSPLGKGLFHKAISQSGVASNPWSLTEWTNKAMSRGFQLAEKLGKVTSDPKVAYEFLKTIDAKKLTKVGQKFLATPVERLQHVLLFTPTLDYESTNPFFPEHPNKLIQRGVKVPWLLGNNSCEGSFLICSTLFGQISKKALKEVDSDFTKTIMPRALSAMSKIPITVEELRFLYFGNKAVSEETLMNYADFLSDVVFNRGIMEAVDIQMSSDSYTPTYLYKLSYESKTYLGKEIIKVTLPGVTHAEDLFFLFYPHMMKEFNLSPPISNSDDYKIIDCLTQMWTNFAKTGDPTPVITNVTPTKWTPLKRGDMCDYLNIDLVPRMESIHSVSIMDNRIEIHVQEGKLIGVVEKGVYNDYYTAFRGIPYAKPPIGELRFKDPVPAEPWSGKRDASKYGNISVQINHFKHEIEGNEDCLYLNVYTTNIKPSKKHAVMVWIHGGGFYQGSGDAVMYGPDYIVRKDVVLVTLNYRLGVLGYLNLYDKVATGNQGLKDVIMALRWVQKNISEFGGNPDNVTIFGESAGGAIVHYLTLSPLAEGLFHKAISQSGVATCPWSLTERQSHSMNKGFRLAKILGKTTADPKVAYEFLKTIDAKKLIETEQESLLTETENLQYSLTCSPTLDHKSSNPVFPEDVKTFKRRGVKVPFLLGFTSCEGSFFPCSNWKGRMSKEKFRKIDSDFKNAILPETLSTLPITVEELRSLYFGDKAISEETLINYVDFLGDEFFYRVSHAEELAYLFYFNMLKDFGMSSPGIDSEDYKMIKCLTQMWTDFAKTGNPTPVTNMWLPVSDSQDGKYNYLNIDTISQMKVFRKGEERWDWEERKNKLQR
ncbi:Esterase E4, partial [Trachymyrmex cornetzi]